MHAEALFGTGSAEGLDTACCGVLWDRGIELAEEQDKKLCV